MLKLLSYIIFFTLCLQTEAECGIFNFWKPAENYEFLDRIENPFINLKQYTREMSRIGNFDRRRAKELYNLPEDVSLPDGLLFIISSLHQKLESDPKNANLYYLMIGDAEHWLGHYREDESSWTEAWHAHVRSLKAYAKTSHDFSPFINAMNVRDHAKSHIYRLYNISHQPIPPELEENPGRQSDKVRSKESMKAIINEILASAPIGNKLSADVNSELTTQEINSTINKCPSIFLESN